MWRKLRILALLLILLFVALGALTDRIYATDWDAPLRATIFPINADGSATAERFIARFRADDLLPLETFFAAEAREYGLPLDRPVRFALAPPLRALPPAFDPEAGLPARMLWSLRTRYWAWRVANPAGPAPDIQLFVLYHDPQRSPSLSHSVGLQKGLFAIVNVFAAPHMMGSNDTIVAHELLHTLGATDKYRPGDGFPMHPAGYAEPDREPLHPQTFAELMGGRIAVSARQATIPQSLNEVLIGPQTAREIGWTHQ